MPEIRMKPLVFVDTYWKQNRTKVNLIHQFVSTIPLNEMRELARELKLNKDIHQYYIVPTNIGLEEIKEAYKEVKWSIIPKKLPRMKFSSKRFDPRFRTVYEYEDFIFTDVKYNNLGSGNFQLSPSDVNRIYAIIEKMKQVPLKRVHNYFRSQRDAYPYRNGKTIIPANITAKIFNNIHSYIREDRTLKQDKIENFISEEKGFHEKNNEINSVIHSNESEITTVSKNIESNLRVNPLKDPAFRLNQDEESRSTNRTNKENPLQPIPSGKMTPRRGNSTVNRIVRASTSVEYLKNLYENVCQICGIPVELGDNQYYSEVHHIQPLGKHLGPDIIENMIVVCPNHHIMFDRGALTINLLTLIVRHAKSNHPLNGSRVLLKHNIQKQYLDYHDQYIFASQKVAPQNSKQKEILTGHYEKRMVLIDLSNQEKLEIQFEKYLQREFMTTLQRAALYQNIGDEFECEGYYYKVSEVF